MDHTNHKMLSKIFVKCRLETVTGLHIGGNSVGFSIGGADSVVVRNALDGTPYIPGSSLRGKLRSLLERARGDEADNNNPEGGFSVSGQGYLAGKKAETLLGKMFGVAAEGEAHGVTRLTVRDAPMEKGSRLRLERAPNTDMPLTEVKTEVWIDRVTSQANPRQIERVPAGVFFEVEFVLTRLTGDDMPRFLNLLFEGMRWLEADTLGGNGSRGYGQVRFDRSSFDLSERTAEQFLKGDPAAALTGFDVPEEFRRGEGA